MAPRSPWRDAKLNCCFGEDLPRILRHHEHRRSWGLTKKWRPIANSYANKPQGGLWAAPVIEPPGKWRPIPRESAWTKWCRWEMPHWINGHWQTQLYPQRDAVFAVIDCAQDAVALYEAFPNDDHPVTAALRGAGAPSHMFGKMIDWRRLLDQHISGVWLTDRGQIETHLPDEDVVPSLYGWDAATVWFSRPAFRVGKTWPCPRIDPDPYDDGWQEDGSHVEGARERLREYGAQARQMLAGEPFVISGDGSEEFPWLLGEEKPDDEPGTD